MWDGVNFKLESAGFFFQEMSRDLIHPRHNPQSQLFFFFMVSTGAIVSHPWQDRFYYHLDAFLAATRSTITIGSRRWRIRFRLRRHGVTRRASEARFGPFFPSIIPVEGGKVGQAYKRAILGAQTRVYKVD